MRTISIDGSIITAPEQLHDILASELCFPCWYGKNFDALHDCLTDIGEETFINIRCYDALQKSIGIKAKTFKRVLIEASIENSLLSVSIE